jgi:voltage-gated sodium channel
MRRLYKGESKLARIMESNIVHGIVGCLVLINAVIIAALTYCSAQDPMHQYLVMVDRLILGCFLVEIGLRLWANGVLFFRSPWNVFDFVIIVGSALPLGFSSQILRALRALRLFYFIEVSAKMRHVVQGFYKALPGISNVFILMLILFFTFSVVGVLLFPNAPRFTDMGSALHTLFQVLSGDDWYNVLRDVLKFYPYAWLFFYTFYIVMVFVILNLFIGVVVGALQSAEDELNQQEDFDIAAAFKELQKRLKDIESKLK